MRCARIAVELLSRFAEVLRVGAKLDDRRTLGAAPIPAGIRFSGTRRHASGPNPFSANSRCALSLLRPKWSLHQCDELITHVDEGRPRLSSSQPEAEIRRKKASTSSIADFERNVIQPGEPLAAPRLRQSLGS